jgi:hypothetical protein
MNFGHVGVKDDWGKLLGPKGNGRLGFKRTADPVFKHEWPDAAAFSWFAYTKQDGQIIYQLSSDARGGTRETPPPMFTLRHLREVLHGRAAIPPLPHGVHDAPGALDWVTLALLARLVQAHGPNDAVGDGLRLGLLTPDNVIALGDPVTELILADAGFRFHGIKLPEWFKKMVRTPQDEEGEGLAALWGFYGESLLKWQSQGGAEALRQGELATVARLLAWVLSDGRVVGPKIERDQGRRDDGRDAAPVWSVLEDVTAEPPKIKSAAKFLEELHKSRPSEHFAGGFVVKPPSPRLWPWAVAATALLALVGGAIYLGWKKPAPPIRSALCPDCPSASKLLPALDELEPVAGRDPTKTDTREQERAFWAVEVAALQKLHEVPRDANDWIARQEASCLKLRRSEIYKRLAASADRFMYLKKGGIAVPREELIRHARFYWEAAEQVRKMSRAKGAGGPDSLPDFCNDVLEWLNRGQREKKSFSEFGFQP